LLPIEKQSLGSATTGSICVVGTIARWDVDAIELLSKYGWTRQLENWQKVSGSLTAAGFQAVAHLSGSIKKRSDGDIQRITSSCLLHWWGLNVPEPT